MATTMATGPSIGPVFFDAVFNTSHAATVTVTSQPVQMGANIADHAYLEPDTVTMDIGMTDAAFDAEQNHSVNAYNMLRSVMEEREPISLYTRLKSYTDMLVVSLSVEDDYKTSTALRATVMLQKILMVNVATVQVQQSVSSSKGGSGGSKTTTTKKDETNTTTTKKSGLKALYDKLAKTEPVTVTTVANTATTANNNKLLKNSLGISRVLD